jgi:cardiolipin synthase
VAFRPVRLYMLDRFNNPTPVRSFVIDGAIGYTGGVGFHDSWLGDGRSPDCWRDVNVRITGAAVTRLQAAFIAHWAEAANELLVDDRLAPAGDSTGSSLDVASPDAVRVSRASVMMSPVTAGTSAAERLFALTIATARRTLWISNAYFVPDVDFVNMLCNAARRGVDLRIITNGRKVDVRLARLAARYRYEKLLEAGVRIFEYEPTVLHSKTFVADGKWCSVGSINFDNRSLSINEEATALVLDEEFGRRLETAFAADLGFSREIRLHEYRMRPLSQRALEFAVDFIWRWL